MSNQAPHVYSAICRVIFDLSHEGIAKNNRNQAQGYNFRGIDDVYNVLSPLLARHHPRSDREDQREGHDALLHGRSR
jgi:hypothetical protein